ncbi:MBL fold metallo-hydrolase [Victivallis sp. Marseille-Q1083]|uniref:MBL fold metallo-hydrolase n=1 Tax=Victivallis sp. Marseille-Q1083 TaxID=2717288 RepID=UPI001588985B|nr:MBL fold metallo-hydrolase [Victivallis sp. Marseille-Q1083]
MFVVRQLEVGGFDDNFSYLFYTREGRAALVDPTGELAVIRRAIAAVPVALQPGYIFLTHSHRDHFGDWPAILAMFPAPVVAHPAASLPIPFRAAGDRERLPLGTGFVEVLYTPGHSPDSVCYRLSDDDGLFTGDTLFVDCCGYGKTEELYRSLQQVIYPLPDSLPVYSGHNYGHLPVTQLGEEKRRNPYLKRQSLAAFSEAMKTL